MSRSTILAVLTALASSLLPLQSAGASTITDAVTAAAPLDTIEVFPGVYHEAVVFEDAAKATSRFGRTATSGR